MKKENGVKVMDSIMAELKKADEIATGIAMAISLIDCTMESNEDEAETIAFLIMSELQEIFKRYDITLDIEEDEEKENITDYVDDDEMLEGSLEEFLNCMFGISDKIEK